MPKKVDHGYTLLTYAVIEVSVVQFILRFPECLLPLESPRVF